MHITRFRLRFPNPFFVFMLVTALYITTFATHAATQIAPGISVDIPTSAKGAALATPIKILIGLTLLSLLPALLVAMTSFTRIVIVLSILRHALGTQETPPNTVLLSLALFLTFFSMSPILTQLDTLAWRPYQSGQVDELQAIAKAEEPLRDFMLRQTREQDLALMVEISKADAPKTVDEVRFAHLVPAFMLSELRTAFQIGFVIFLPFLLIDLIVSSVLMALGMMMVPPVMVSLPLKILMFVVIDGWSLIVKALVGSIH
jgi:flagellar biosynthetic protein FliP